MGIKVTESHPPNVASSSPLCTLFGRASYTKVRSSFLLIRQPTVWWSPSAVQSIMKYTM